MNLFHTCMRVLCAGFVLILRSAGSTCLYYCVAVDGYKSKPVNRHIICSVSAPQSKQSKHHETQHEQTSFQSRFLWPLRSCDPCAYGETRSGLWFPPYFPFTHVQVEILIRSDGDLSQCVVFADLPPRSVFSVRGRTFSITRKGIWMAALLAGLHVGFVRTCGSPRTAMTA